MSENDVVEILKARLSLDCSYVNKYDFDGERDVSKYVYNVKLMLDGNEVISEVTLG